MVWRAEDPQCNEAGKVLWELVPYTRGLGLDIGCGPAKAFPHFIGVDNRKDTALFGIKMDPDMTVPDATSLSMWSDKSVDFIFSSHMLEHIVDYKGCLREWWRLIKEGGHLCLYLPDEDEYPKVGTPGANPDHKWDVNYDKIVDAMKEIGSWDLLRFEKRNQGAEYSLFFVFKKISGGE